MGSLNILERQVEEFIQEMRPEKEIRDEIDIGFKLEDNVLEIFEIRPVWNDKSQIAHYSVARSKLIKSRSVWKIYWMRADLKWHVYQPRPEVKTVREFLEEVREDPYGCFFG